MEIGHAEYVPRSPGAGEEQGSFIPTRGPTPHALFPPSFLLWFQTTRTLPGILYRIPTILFCEQLTRVWEPVHFDAAPELYIFLHGS